MYLVHCNFCNWLPFFTGHCSGKLAVLPQTSLLNIRGEGKKSREGNGWNVGGATTGLDGKGTDEEKEEDRHPPHVRSAPTFQPRLRIWSLRVLGTPASYAERLNRSRYRLDMFYSLSCPTVIPSLTVWENDRIKRHHWTKAHILIMMTFQ